MQIWRHPLPLILSVLQSKDIPGPGLMRQLSELKKVRHYCEILGSRNTGTHLPGSTLFEGMSLGISRMVGSEYEILRLRKGATPGGER